MAKKSTPKTKQITNIAITGPYGSGKSSVIKSFQKQYKKKDLRFLNLSLATFRDGDIEDKDKEDNCNPHQRQPAEMLRLIEYSILQQIFYHENDEKIPGSRFRKIKRLRWYQIFVRTMGVLLLFVSVANILLPNFVQAIFKDHPLNERMCDWLHYGSYCVILSAIFIGGWQLIPLLSSFKISHFKFHNTEINVDETSKKSILNHHLDEIIYFFEATRYNVVIIEDLDRFKQTEIFTKLREINLLLNSSKKTRDMHIVFIYAVKDDMFQNTDRSKFFDFIIPIIPIINASNSSEILLRKNNENNYGLSTQLIDDISLFISDMRLLFNIVNEFHLYKLNLDDKLDVDVLLAIVVYKNLFPLDFTLLARGEGDLFKALHSKRSLIAGRTNEIDVKIKELNVELERLESVRLKNVSELRSLYILKTIQMVEGFAGFRHQRQISVSSLLEDHFFQMLIDGKLSYYNTGQAVQPLPSFESIQTAVDTEPYSKRKALVEQLNIAKKDDIRDEIRKYEREKERLGNMKLKEVVASYGTHMFVSTNSPSTDLISLLVRNGYINEDYLHYISVFHEGSISRADHQFIICVKTRRKLNFDYKLDKVNNVLAKLTGADFENECVLNFDLVDALTNNNTLAQTDWLFRLLGNESHHSIQFIDTYIDKAANKPEFVRLLCKNWTHIWKHIQFLNFPDYRKRVFFINILRCADIGDIKNIADTSNLRDQILQDRDFFSLEIEEAKLEQLIETLGLLFIDVELKSAPPAIANFIYEGGWFEINVTMIQSILEYKDRFDSIAFTTMNYACILKSQLNILVEKINSDLDRYINEVYIKLNENVLEAPEILSKLLNANISEPTFTALLGHTYTRLPVSLLATVDHRITVVNSDKATHEWENLTTLFEDNGNNSMMAIVNFLQTSNNAEILCAHKFEIVSAGDSEALYRSFWITLLEYDDFSIDIYKHLVTANTLAIGDFNASSVSYDKLVLLIQYKCVTLTVANYTSLKVEEIRLSILLLEVNKAQYLQDTSGYLLDSEDVFLILTSAEFTSGEKSSILKGITESVIAATTENLNSLANHIDNDAAFVVSDELAFKLITSPDVAINKRIKVFNKKHSQINDDSLTMFLNSLGEPYSHVNLKGNRAMFQIDDDHSTLVLILKAKKRIFFYRKSAKGIEVRAPED